jgi:hypothetical protein
MFLEAEGPVVNHPYRDEPSLEENRSGRMELKWSDY